MEDREKEKGEKNGIGEKKEEGGEEGRGRERHRRRRLKQNALKRSAQCTP